MKLAPTVLLLSLISSTAFAKTTNYRLKDSRCFVTATGKENHAGPFPSRTFECYFAEHESWEFFSCVTVGEASKTYSHTREPANIGRPDGTWHDVKTRSELIIDSSLEYVWTQTLTNGETLVSLRCTGEAEKY